MAHNAPQLYKDLQRHLADLEKDPVHPLDKRLVDECSFFLTGHLLNNADLGAGLVQRISVMLPSFQQDPTPLTSLLIKLTEPYSFADVQRFEPPVDFVGALDPVAQPYHLLALCLLGKAAKSPGEVAQLANMPAVVKALVNLWLVTADTGVAEKAAKVLEDLLKTDKEQSRVSVHGVGENGLQGTRGLGMMWRRVFGDKDVYGSIFSICSPRDLASMGKKEKTLAQARLLGLVPKIAALDWDYTSRSHHPHIESQHGLDGIKEGMIDFAAVHMVDHKDDVLMHISLIRFFADLISEVKTPSRHDQHKSPALIYLQSHSLHSRTASYWLHSSQNPDPITQPYIVSPSAHYLSIYASHYPCVFLQDPDVPNLLSRLASNLDIPAWRWTGGQSPAQDLNLLTSLPRVALLPKSRSRTSSPLLIIRCTHANADALNALATIFRGPTRHRQIHNEDSDPDSIEEAESAALEHAEAAAARACLIAYSAWHEDLFPDLAAHATNPAFLDRALASINLISALASANWSPLPETPPGTGTVDHPRAPASPTTLPTTNQLLSLLPTSSSTTDPPNSGIAVLLNGPARQHIVPWLLSPPQTFTHLAAGRGDPEGAAYRLATAKWDCIRVCAGALAEFLEGRKRSGVDLENLPGGSGARRELQRVRAEVFGVLGRVGEGGSEGQADSDRDVERARELLAALMARIGEGVWGAGSDAGSRVAALEM